MDHRPRKIWLTTDTHFRHHKMIAKGYRPADFEYRIEKNWNRLINPLDVVIHLGDVICGHDEDLSMINDRLNGTKILVRGNHDHGRSFTWFVDHGFASVCDGMTIGNIYLTHEPSVGLPPNCIVNVHGHLHSDGHRDDEYNLQPYHCLLSLEATDYHPVELHSFVQKHLAKMMSDAVYPLKTVPHVVHAH